MNKTVEIIIVNYNCPKKVVHENLESIFCQTYPAIRVTVVDNASIPESIRYYEEYGSRLRLLKNTENLGFGCANNLAIRESRADYLFLVNNDIILEPDCVEKLVDSMAQLEKREKIGALNCLMLNYYDPDFLDSAGIGLPRLHKPCDLFHRRRRFDIPDHLPISGVCAGAGFYRREFFEETGLFDEKMFILFEDVDLALRGLWLGWSYRLAAKAVCHHYKSFSINSSQQSNPRLAKKIRLCYRYNMARLVFKNSATPRNWLYLAYFLQRDLLNIFKFSSTAFAAYWQLLRDLPGLIRERKKLMRERKISPAEFRKKSMLNTGPGGISPVSPKT
jgi:GT2 family glycosyltransferase